MATAARTLHASPTTSGVGVKLLVIIAFLVTCMPLARVVIGSAPIYVIDVTILAAWAHVLSRGRQNLSSLAPLPTLMAAYAMTIVLSGVREGAAYGAFFYPVYMVGRNVLSVSLLLLVPMIASTPNQLARVVKAMIAGGVVTSFIAAGWALPGTGRLVRTYVFNSFLFPEREGLTMMTAIDPSIGMRAQALVGGENMVGCFVLVSLPLAVSMWREGVPATSWFRTLRFAALPVGLLACLLTYSRSTYLALALLLAVIAATRMLRIPRPLVIAAAVGAGLLVFYGAQQDTDAFKFDYVVAKIEYAAEDPAEQETDQARILAYTEILPFLVENPSWLVVGRGDASEKLRKRTGMSEYQLLMQMRDARNHSAWAATFYNRGFIAVILLLSVVLITAMRVWTTRRLAQRYTPEWSWLADGLLLTMVAMSPFLMFASFLGTSVQGEALAFLTFGVAATFRARVLERVEQSDADA